MVVGFGKDVDLKYSYVSQEVHELSLIDVLKCSSFSFAIMLNLPLSRLPNELLDSIVEHLAADSRFDNDKVLY